MTTMNWENICDECFECECFVQNTDTGEECMGQTEPCHEFRKLKGDAE